MSISTDRSYIVRPAAWPADRPALRRIREAVFVVEQKVPPELEWDGEDGNAVHFLAETGERVPIGCARLLVSAGTAHFGRMAVLAEWRGCGVGRKLLQALVARAKAAGLSRAWLNAQTAALRFYEKQGFVRIGEEFMDAGIPHFRMERSL